jgi:hypothetical protein
MPVRIELPRSGVRMEYERYWLPAGQPATLSFRYLRQQLVHPIAFFLGVLIVVAARLAARGRRLAVRLVALALAGVGGGLLVEAVGAQAALAVFVAAGLVALWPPGWRPRTVAADLGQWARTLPERYRADRERTAAEAQAMRELEVDSGGEATSTRYPRFGSWATAGRVAWRSTLAALLGVALWSLAHQTVALVEQLAHPLGG